ncbi:RNHCP domain-containing protein [Sinosporangium siamense]|uniref:RNHCP domain-containing protein n=1 Tax=Sinosporangium siamense TaxID=1367973 RepID=A0A919RHH6_9ACTN|nr:RNHCP domain-containing protein [Sinosporangium siamense]GII93698.1 RNHCP domain-containing protein [Sinosporangium siamense]
MPRNRTRTHVSSKRAHERTSPRSTSNSFRCVHCRLDVSLDAPGTSHRNHCPNCLWSRHLDNTPGDRAADCGASMSPIAIHVRPNGEWSIVHRCAACDTLDVNRIAGDDNPLSLMRLAVAPLAQPPFPLDWFGRL